MAVSCQFTCATSLGIRLKLSVLLLSNRIVFKSLQERKQLCAWSTNNCFRYDKSNYTEVNQYQHKGLQTIPKDLCTAHNPRDKQRLLQCGARFLQSVIKLYSFRSKAASHQSCDEPPNDPHSRPQLCTILSLSHFSHSRLDKGPDLPMLPPARISCSSFHSNHSPTHLAAPPQSTSLS